MSCCVNGCTNTNRTNKSITYHVFPHPLKEKFRHKEWIKAANNSKLIKKDPMAVFRQFRICRKHFDTDCFNGGCRRLLHTAVPTLYLSPPTKNCTQLRTINKNNKAIKPITEKYLIDINIDESVKSDEGSFVLYKEDESDLEMEEEPIENFCIRDSPKTEFSKNSNSTENLQHLIINDNNGQEYYDLVDVIENFIKTPVNENLIKTWRTDFYKEPKNILAQNVCSRVDPFDVCLSRKSLENTNHVFTYKIENEGKPLTNQKNSGRCWIFATLNCIRIPFMREYNIDEFEFSQSYLFYWDKIERCNYFLNNIVETAQRGEEVNGRLVSFLLQDPTCDGGQWDMIVNLINKHGLMPKKCFPDTFSCEASVRMNSILKSKLREYAKELHDLVANSSTEDDLKAKINHQMGEIYNIIGICLSIPSEKFTWEYYDKSKVYHSIGPITPVDFYEKYVKSSFNVDDKICLVTDPRPSNPYEQLYTVDCLGNVVGGRQVLYNNQKVELLMDLVKKSLTHGEPVWFGCEVNKRFAGKNGIETLDIHDFKLVFNVDIQVTMDKADRLLYGESMMTHAMVFTGVSVDSEDKPVKFRVENSWGEDRGEKGYIVMSKDWFKEFVFEIVIDKTIVPKDVLDIFNLQPITLPAWDPMGTLAQ